MSKQNRLAIELVQECLVANGFVGVEASGDRGTFPNIYIAARRSDLRYFVGVTSRAEIGADGDYNPSYNIVQTGADMQNATAMASVRREIPAFGAIALRKDAGTYSAYFGTLEAVNYKRSIPMLPQGPRQV